MGFSQVEYGIEANSAVFNMDCMELMACVPDKYFDLAVVDPPYGIRRDEGFEGFEGFGGFGRPIARKRYKGWGDENTPSDQYFKELFRVSKNSIIWGGNFFTDKIPVNGHWIFWDKKNTMPTFGDGELAYTTIKRNSVKQVDIEYNGLLGKEANRIHATQKPVRLYIWIFKNYAQPGMKILDTHLGSGSSRIAAHRAGMKFIGTEIDRDYFEAHQKRWKNFISQTVLDFDAPNL